jgi:hypothetical protein
MDFNTEEKANAHIQNGYRYSISEVVGNGFEIWKKGIPMFLVFTLIYLILSFVIGLIPVIGSLASNFVLAPIFLAGSLFLAEEFNKGNNPGFETIKKSLDFIPKLIVVILIKFAVTILLFLPLVPFFIKLWPIIVDISENPDAYTTIEDYTAIDWPALGGLIFYIPFLIIGSIVIATMWMLSPLHILFNDASPWESMEWSRKVISKDFFSALGVIILGAILSISGFLLCGIGVIITIPILYCVTFALYYKLYPSSIEDSHQELI